MEPNWFQPQVNSATCLGMRLSSRAKDLIWERSKSLQGETGKELGDQL